jgi:DNA-binding transcriptional LysR family regulator
MVAKEQHVTRAAARLGVAQPTLSRNMARLEADLGTALFLRTGRTVRLTRHGALLLPHVERALAALETGLAELHEDLDASRGRVALAFMHSLGARAVPMLLREFRERHPAVRFALIQHAHGTMLDLVRSGAVDLCLTSPAPSEPGLAVRVVAEQRLDLMVPRGHRLAVRRRVRLAEVHDDDFVGLEEGYSLRRITDDWCRQVGFTPRVAFEGEEIATVVGLVESGLGVALLPQGAAVAHDVAELMVTHPRTTRSIALVWRADRELPAPARAFRDTVVKAKNRLLAVDRTGDAGPSATARS